MNPSNASHIVTFELRGEVLPYEDLAKAADVEGRKLPTRPMGGWLTTYGKIGPDGGVVPTVDRDGQTFDAARELGHIDWSRYLPPNGLWNDTHRDGVIFSPKIMVGVPETLEFHDGATAHSQAHGKVGFWTTGHLFDPAKPESWKDYTNHQPTPLDLERADYYWDLAKAFEGTQRRLAFSAHGRAGTDPTKKHILWAAITQAAVCEVPKHPDSTAEILCKSMNPLEALAKAVLGAPGEDLLESDLRQLGIRPGDGAWMKALLEKIRKDYLFSTPEEALAWLKNALQRQREAANA